MLNERLAKRRAAKRAQRKAKSKGFDDINMTPILDMTFLLLIAFLITFPALQNGIPMQLPRASADPLPTDTEPLSIAIRADGRLFLNNAPVTDAMLEEQVRAAIAKNPKIPAHLRGDENQNYGRVMDVIKILRRAKLTRFSLVTESE